MQFEIDRTDYIILTALCDEDIALDRPTDGLTINEISEYLDSINFSRCYKSVYQHLVKLVQKSYLSKGLRNEHANTYYITGKGLSALKGEF